MVSQTLKVRLSRSDNQPWGFRISGGTDFFTPLTISKVERGSLAEEAGLKVDDIIMEINDIDAVKLRHNQAKDIISREGDQFTLVLQRGAAPVQTWQPKVTNLSRPIINGGPMGDDIRYTKTSLAAPRQKEKFLKDFTNVLPIPFDPKKLYKRPMRVLPFNTYTASASINNRNDIAIAKIAPTARHTVKCDERRSLQSQTQEAAKIGSAHNAQPKPFYGEVTGKTLVNKQFNSPIKLYSDKNIAEAISAQSEVLSTGAVGVNFQKNEKQFKGGSDVYRMVQEMDLNASDYRTGTHIPYMNRISREIKKPQSVACAQSKTFWHLKSSLENKTANSKGKDDRRQETSSKSTDRIITSVAPPEARDNVTIQTTDEVRCAECDKAIQGPFVRLKQKICLHDNCFKCTTCGTSLKNAGYYMINEKLYCEIHAKQVSQQFRTSPDLTSDTSTFRNQSPLSSRIGPMSSSPVKNSFPGTKTQILETKREEYSYKSQSHFQDSSGFNQQPNIRRSPAATPIRNVQKASPGGSKFIWPPPKNQSDSDSFSPASTRHQYNSSEVSQTSPPSLVVSDTPPYLNRTLPRSSSPYVEAGRQKPGGIFAPRRGTGGTMNPQVSSGVRIPICEVTRRPIRGPYVSALGKTWCPEYFVCSIANCRRNLLDIGFVEENDKLYCENCYMNYLAPTCYRCNRKIGADCLKAVGKCFHPECFLCVKCGRAIGTNIFYWENGSPYCEADWIQEFTVRCDGCLYAIEPGDTWVEALNKSYHSQCFTCTICGVPLEGKSFFAKGNRPFCKTHAKA